MSQVGEVGLLPWVRRFLWGVEEDLGKMHKKLLEAGRVAWDVYVGVVNASVLDEVVGKARGVVEAVDAVVFDILELMRRVGEARLRGVEGFKDVVMSEFAPKSGYRVCPRCGKRYDWLERKIIYGRTYVYAVHEHKEGGKKYRKRCYLGPAYGYKHGTATHGGLVLKSAVDRARLFDYLYTLVVYLLKDPERVLDKLGVDKSMAADLGTQLEMLAKVLKNL